MRAVEASAKTREEAIQIGLKELGIEMYEVDKIEILDEGSKGLFGFGARPVKVRLVAENMPDLPVRKPEREEARAPRQERNDRGDRGDRGDRNRNENRDRNRDQEKPREPRGERPQGERSDRGDRNRNENRDRNQDRGPRNDRGGDRNDRGGRDRNRGRNDRGDRNDRGPRNDRGGRGGGRGDQSRPAIPRGDSEYGYDPGFEDQPEEGSIAAVAAAAAGRVQAERAPREERPAREPRAPRPPREPREPRAPRAEDAGDGDNADLSPEELASQHEQSRELEEASFAPLTDQQGEEAASFVSELIQKMGIEAGVQFNRAEDGGARLSVESEDGAILIGRKGRTLGALQYVINRVISRGDTAENTERLIVDVGGYVDRRRESLEDMARNLAAKAKDTGRNMRLKPMSPQERRIIHVTLQGDEEVRTYSLGESLYRSVVISPKNASPEAPSRGPRGGRSRGHRGGRGRGGQRRDRFEVDAGQFGD